MPPSVMWSNGFLFTIDLHRRGSPVVLLFVVAGLAAGTAAVWSSVPDWRVRVAMVVFGCVAAVRALLQERPASPSFVRRLVAGGDRRWRLETGGDGIEAAELAAAWIAGPVAALAFRTAGGRWTRGRWRSVVVVKGQLTAADWRRFLVRIRHP